VPSALLAFALGRTWDVCCRGVHEQVGVAAGWLAGGTGGTQGVDHTHTTDAVSMSLQ